MFNYILIFILGLLFSFIPIVEYIYNNNFDTSAIIFLLIMIGFLVYLIKVLINEYKDKIE